MKNSVYDTAHNVAFLLMIAFFVTVTLMWTL
jgi:hypothetical protein